MRLVCLHFEQYSAMRSGLGSKYTDQQPDRNERPTRNAITEHKLRLFVGLQQYFYVILWEDNMHTTDQ